MNDGSVRVFYWKQNETDCGGLLFAVQVLIHRIKPVGPDIAKQPIKNLRIRVNALQPGSINPQVKTRPQNPLHNIPHQVPNHWDQFHLAQ